MPITDAERIDELERLVNEQGGLVLHTGEFSGAQLGSFAGLGLRPGCLRRTLRQAIDDMITARRRHAAAE